MKRVKGFLKKNKQAIRHDGRVASQGPHTLVTHTVWPVDNADSWPRPYAQPNPAELEAHVAHRVPIYVLSQDELSRSPPEQQQSPQRLSGRQETDRQLAAEWNAQARAEEKMTDRLHNASTQNVRRLRGLIREKYQLDVYVWSKRGVQQVMRPKVEQSAYRSDAIWQEILFIVNEWEEDAFHAPEEWELAKKIKDIFTESDHQHLLWRDLPPWDDRRLRTSSESWE